MGIAVITIMDEYKITISCIRCKRWYDMKVLGCMPTDNIEILSNTFYCPKCTKQTIMDKYLILDTFK